MGHHQPTGETMMIKKGGLTTGAMTATVATVATDERETEASVASAASVAVANPRNSKSALSKMNAVAKESGIPLAELMDWYREDLEAIALMPMEQLRFIVVDYLNNRDFYREQLDPIAQPSSVQ